MTPRWNIADALPESADLRYQAAACSWLCGKSRPFSVQEPKLQHRSVVTEFRRLLIQDNSFGSISIDPFTAPVPFRKTVHGARVTSSGGGLNPIEVHSIANVAGQASERFSVCGDQG